MKPSILIKNIVQVLNIKSFKIPIITYKTSSGVSFNRGNLINLRRGL
jgi:hypothetical protein